MTKNCFIKQHLRQKKSSEARDWTEGSCLTNYRHEEKGQPVVTKIEMRDINEDEIYRRIETMNVGEK